MATGLQLDGVGLMLGSTQLLVAVVPWLSSSVRAMTSPRGRSYCSPPQDQELQKFTVKLACLIP